MSQGNARRLRTAVVWGGIAALYGLMRHVLRPDFTSDLDQLWYAARALLAGRDPYAVVGPGREFPWAWPVFYPLPAILLTAPLALLPVAAARVVFATVAAGALGFGVGERWRILWPLLLSTAFSLAISRNQWSPFIAASFSVPAFGFVLAAKPNVGLLSLATQRTWKGVLVVAAGAGILLVLSLMVRPSWIGEWIALAQSAPNKEIFVLQPGGFLLLGSLLLWKQPEGRLLAVLSLVPHTPSLYDLLPAFAICRSLRQTLLLTLLTHMLFLGNIQQGPYTTFDAYYSALGRLAVPVVMLPTFGIALWNAFVSRAGDGVSTGETAPNATSLPATWFDRLLLVGSATLLGIELWAVLL